MVLGRLLSATAELLPFDSQLEIELEKALEKRNYLSYSRNPQEIALMRTLKQAFDPKNILNPGKIFAVV